MIDPSLLKQIEGDVAQASELVERATRAYQTALDVEGQRQLSQALGTYERVYADYDQALNLLRDHVDADQSGIALARLRKLRGEAEQLNRRAEQGRADAQAALQRCQQLQAEAASKLAAARQALDERRFQDVRDLAADALAIDPGLQSEASRLQRQVVELEPTSNTRTWIVVVVLLVVVAVILAIFLPGVIRQIQQFFFPAPTGLVPLLPGSGM